MGRSRTGRRGRGDRPATAVLDANRRRLRSETERNLRQLGRSRATPALTVSARRLSLRRRPVRDQPRSGETSGPGGARRLARSRHCMTIMRYRRRTCPGAATTGPSTARGDRHRRRRRHRRRGRAQLRAAGAKVVAEDIEPAVERLADDGIAALCADAADAETARAAVDLALTRFGRLDVVVNNAGPLPAQADRRDDGRRVGWADDHQRAQRLRPLPRGAAAPHRARPVARSSTSRRSRASSGFRRRAPTARPRARSPRSRGSSRSSTPPTACASTPSPPARSTPTFVDAALAGAPDLQAARGDIGASHPLGRMASTERDRPHHGLPGLARRRAS